MNGSDAFAMEEEVSARATRIEKRNTVQQATLRIVLVPTMYLRLQELNGAFFQAVAAGNESAEADYQLKKTACATGEAYPKSMLLQVASHVLVISEMDVSGFVVCRRSLVWRSQKKPCPRTVVWRSQILEQKQIRQILSSRR